MQSWVRLALKGDSRWEPGLRPELDICRSPWLRDPCESCCHPHSPLCKPSSQASSQVLLNVQTEAYACLSETRTTPPFCCGRSAMRAVSSAPAIPGGNMSRIGMQAAKAASLTLQTKSLWPAPCCLCRLWCCPPFHGWVPASKRQQPPSEDDKSRRGRFTDGLQPSCRVAGFGSGHHGTFICPTIFPPVSCSLDCVIPCVLYRFITKAVAAVHPPLTSSAPCTPACTRPWRWATCQVRAAQPCLQTQCKQLRRLVPESCAT